MSGIPPIVAWTILPPLRLLACPYCGSDVSDRVWSGIFNGDFWLNAGLTLLPIPVVWDRAFLGSGVLLCLSGLALLHSARGHLSRRGDLTRTQGTDGPRGVRHDTGADST